MNHFLSVHFFIFQIPNLPKFTSQVVGRFIKVDLFVKSNYCTNITVDIVLISAMYKDSLYTILHFKDFLLLVFVNQKKLKEDFYMDICTKL